jgi:hypothetical protein
MVWNGPLPRARLFCSAFAFLHSIGRLKALASTKELDVGTVRFYRTVISTVSASDPGSHHSS